MQEFDPMVFVAVFQEMLGPLLWLLVAGAIATTLAFLYVVIRDRGMRSRRFVWSEVVGVLGGCAAIWFMQLITHSGFADIGGPIDWVLVAVIWVMGAIGATIFAYAALGLAAKQ